MASTSVAEAPKCSARLAAARASGSHSAARAAGARAAILETFAPLVSIGARSRQEARRIAARWAWMGQWTYAEKLLDARALSREFGRPMSMLAMQLE